MLKAVIFDFDGVLVDSEKLHLQAFNRVFEKLNSALADKFQISAQEYYERFLGLSDKELLQIVTQEKNLSLSGRRFEQLLAEKAEAFKTLASTQAAIYPGVPQFLKMLAVHKIPMAICSGALMAEIELLLKGADLRNYFDIIVSAEQVKKGKPDPEGFLLALKLLNEKARQKIEPKDCIVIEDSHWGLEAAKAAGMHPVAVTNTYSAELLKPADKVIANLGELTIGDLHILSS